ncbi:M4 family metallopeptidase [Paractinoplanes deccanensis]|uniref:M4 family metallopeptidase n=1 Tax=Paractinoplanes deccanensis TaxID=113561 RepID=UPI001EF38501|nr:M4 family metallopeptidase [Actinoplanes deccanensis]
MLDQLSGAADADLSDAARATLRTTAHLRAERSERKAGTGITRTGAAREVFDCRHAETPDNGVLIRGEGQPPVEDATVNRAYDALGVVRDFYREVLHRDSIDDSGRGLRAYVHFANRYNNAVWDGQQIKIGDGDGKVMRDLTYGLDVLGHELTHAMTAATANFEFRSQSGALDESVADVFGSLVRQWALRQTVDEADWLLGGSIFTPGIGLDAMRSMKAPGTAYDNKLVGKDPQPAHMKDYRALPETQQGDFGGVHINSGIPNRAFYLAATALGGHAWERAGRIWYEAVQVSTPRTRFADFAATTATTAARLYGPASTEHDAVAGAWEQVGVTGIVPA